MHGPDTTSRQARPPERRPTAARRWGRAVCIGDSPGSATPQRALPSSWPTSGRLARRPVPLRSSAAPRPSSVGCSPSSQSCFYLGLAPQRWQRGRWNLGIWSIANTLPQVLSPTIDGLGLVALNRQAPNLGYTAIFSTAVVYVASGYILVWKIKNGKSKGI